MPRHLASGELEGTRDTLARLRSSVETIRWPAIASGRQSEVLALLYQLEQTQWWDPDRLQAHQLHEAARVLRHAKRSVPLYRETLRGADLGTEDNASAEAWRDLPRMTRDAVQGAGDGAKAERLPAGHGQLVVKQTSGSTGEPARFLGTGITELFWHTLTLRDHMWHRRDFGGRLVAIRSGRYAKDPLEILDQPSWGPPAEWLFDTGPSTRFYHRLPIERQAELLCSKPAATVLTHPSNAAALAAYFLNGSENAPPIDQIRSFGDVVPTDLHALCERVFGATLVDIYSTEELGYLALQCPEHGHYHVQSESVLLEVLDDDGRACGPGETGQVVVTALHNYAMPLIRYETGDYAEVGAPCPCGRGLPVLARVLGRRRNQILLPDGRTIWPRLSLLPDGVDGPVRIVQLVQRGMDEVEARWVAPAPVGTDAEDRLRMDLRELLGPEIGITVSRHGRIEQQPTGKFEWVLSELLDG